MLSGASSYLVVRRERMRNSRVTLLGLVRNPMVIFSLLMIVSVTAHWVLVVKQSFLAFLYFDGGAAAFMEYADAALWPSLARICLLNVTIATADAVMVYRAWVIWGFSFLPIALPALFWIGDALVCSVGMIDALSRYKIGDPRTKINAWVLGGTSLTLATNFSCAVLISWKLYRTHSHAKSFGTSLLSLLAIIVESAAIYVAWTVAYLTSFAISTDLSDPLCDLWAPVAGIAFMLINVRVGAGWGMHNSLQSPPHSATKHTAHVQVQRKNMTEVEPTGELGSYISNVSERDSDDFKIRTMSIEDASAAIV